MQPKLLIFLFTISFVFLAAVADLIPEPEALANPEPEPEALASIDAELKPAAYDCDCEYIDEYYAAPEYTGNRKNNDRRTVNRNGRVNQNQLNRQKNKHGKNVNDRRNYQIGKGKQHNNQVKQRQSQHQRQHVNQFRNQRQNQWNSHRNQYPIKRQNQWNQRKQRNQKPQKYQQVQRKQRLNKIPVGSSIETVPESLPATADPNNTAAHKFTANAAFAKLATDAGVLKTIEHTKTVKITETAQPFAVPEDIKTPVLSKPAGESMVAAPTKIVEPTKMVEEPKTPSSFEAQKRTYAEELSKTPDDTKITGVLPKALPDTSSETPEAIPAPAAVAF